MGQKEPPRLGSTICYGQTWARKSHQDSAVRFVTAKRGPERAIKTRQYDLLRPRVGQKKPPRLGSTICYGKTWARKSHQDSAVRFVAAKSWPERATKTRQYDLLRPNVGQKEPPRLGSTICYGQTWARKSQQDSAVRFVTAKHWPEKATKTRQYDLLRTTERATETRQYDVLLPNVGQKEPPRLGSPICYGQTCHTRLGSTICHGQELARKSHRDSAVRFVTAKSVARKSHQDSAVRFVTAKRGPERATKTRQYDLLRPRVGQKKPPRLSSTICCGQTWARKSQQDSDLIRPRVGQKKPPRLGSAICYGHEIGQKEPPNSAVRFVTAKRVPERATKTRQYDLLRPRVGQKEPPRLGSTICYGQELARKSHQASAVRFVTAKSWPERATETRQYDLLRPTERPPRLGSTICYCQTWARKSPRLGSPICYGQTWARKSHQDSAVRFVTAKSCPERATKTRQYDLLRPSIGQKKPPRLGSTICYGQTWARMSQQDSAVRFVTAKSWPDRATETRQYDLLRPNVGQKEPPRLGSTISYGQTWARKSHQDSAVRFVTAKNWPEKATKTRQYDLLRPKRGPGRATKIRQYDLLWPRVGQNKPPRLGSTICYGQMWARKSHQDSAVRFVTAKRGPERATETRQYDLSRPRRWPERVTETRQYDLLRPRVGQKEPPRLGSTICYGQTWARKSHQDSAVRFVTAKRGPERAIKTRQYDLLRPNVGQKESPRLGSTICCGQELARKSHRDSAVLFVTAKSLARKSHQDTAVRFVTAKRGPEKATKTRQYDLLWRRVGQKEPPRLGSTILLRPRVGQKEPPRLGSTICYGQELARKSHQDSAVRFVTAKRWPNKSYCRVLVALSGPRLAVTNRTPESWWLYLANSWPQHIVLPSLGGSFWPTFSRNKSYCRVLVAFSGQLLAVTNRTAESWWLFLDNSWP